MSVSNHLFIKSQRIIKEASVVTRVPLKKLVLEDWSLGYPNDITPQTTFGLVGAVVAESTLSYVYGEGLLILYWGLQEEGLGLYGQIFRRVGQNFWGFKRPPKAVKICGGRRKGRKKERVAFPCILGTGVTCRTDRYPRNIRLYRTQKLCP